MTTSIRSAQAWLVALICLTLGACNAGRDASDASLEGSVPALPGSNMQALAPSSSMALVEAVAVLPDEAGAVASVRGHGYVDGFRQDILLKGGAMRGVENGITVLARTSQQQTLDERLPLFKPTEAAIRAEMGRAFPRIAMQVVQRPSSNGYGVYGLALGRANDTTRCVYMWQWIDGSSLPRDIAGPVSVRIRLCKADTTFDALAALLDHLTIQRDAGGATVAATIVEPPVEDAQPSHKVAAHAKHRMHRLAAVHPTPAAETPLAYGPGAPSQSTVDLPPQAFLGPTARSLKQN